MFNTLENNVSINSLIEGLIKSKINQKRFSLMIQTWKKADKVNNFYGLKNYHTITTVFKAATWNLPNNNLRLNI